MEELNKEEKEACRDVSSLECLIYKANIFNIQNSHDFQEFMNEVKNIEISISLAS